MSAEADKLDQWSSDQHGRLISLHETGEFTEHHKLANLIADARKYAAILRTSEMLSTYGNHSPKKINKTAAQGQRITDHRRPPIHP